MSPWRLLPVETRVQVAELDTTLIVEVIDATQHSVEARFLATVDHVRVAH
jgi:hypothetical protein